MTGPRVAFGADVLVAERFARWRGRRVGAIVNPASLDHRLRHLADELAAAPGVRLAALFGPEHGAKGEAQDMEPTEALVEGAVPTYGLYGETFESLSPRPEWLEGLDVLAFDLQDVGSRHYTFAATMFYAMRAAAGRGLAFVVLDRPNPLGGEAIEGPGVRPGFESFVGAFDVPIRHGLTVGELALMYRAETGLDLDLTVVPCQGWERWATWDQLERPWASPSPNMPTLETARVYPGGCLVEGTNLSERRGTTRPFENWGAPWIDAGRLAETARALGLPGSALRAGSFRPMFHKHAGRSCQGVQPHVVDPARFRPVWTYLALIALAREQSPGDFAWRTAPYEFVADPIAIDLLFGSDRERLAIESGDWRGLPEAWAVEESAFRERREPHLLYRTARNAGRVFMNGPESILKVDGAVARPLELTRADLLAIEEGHQVPDVSRWHPKRRGDAVTLDSVLALAGPLPGADYLTLHAAKDDFHASVPLDEVRGEGLIVYRLGAAPLGPEDGGPVRFLVRDPGACKAQELDDCANVKYVDRIELSIGRGRDNRPLDEREHEALHAKE